MISHRHILSRRTAVAGLLTGRLAFAASRLGVCAQDASPTADADGVWAPTGPNTVNYTLIVIDAQAGTYTMIRGSIEVDATGETATASYSRTVAADGTVVDQQAEATAQYIRLQIEPQDGVWTPLANFPAWTPATPEAD